MLKTISRLSVDAHRLSAARPRGRIAPAPSSLAVCALALALVSCSGADDGTSLTVSPPALLPAIPAASEPTPTSPSACSNQARYLEDLSLPDGSVVEPGAEVVKRWSVANEGTCDWGPGYRLVHVGGDGLAGPEAVALFPARAGSAATWEVTLRAPDLPGEYRSEWRAAAPDGTPFGDLVFVILVVEESPASTAAP